MASARTGAPVRALCVCLAMAGMVGLGGCGNGKIGSDPTQVQRAPSPVVVEEMRDAKGTVRLQLSATNQPREANTLVAYTEGQTPDRRTGTNNHGLEITVVGQRIIQAGGNNSLVPRANSI